MVVGARLSYNDAAGDYGGDEFGGRLTFSYQGKFADDTFGVAVGYSYLEQPNAFIFNRAGADDQLGYGTREDVDGITFAPATTAHYTLVNLHGSYRIAPQWTTFAKLENLFDEDYELASRYNSPGRALSLGLRYQYE